MDNVARKVIIVQKCHSQPARLGVMCLEKLLYVIFDCHTQIIHTTYPELNSEIKFYMKKFRYTPCPF